MILYRRWDSNPGLSIAGKSYGRIENNLFLRDFYAFFLPFMERSSITTPLPQILVNMVLSIQLSIGLNWVQLFFIEGLNN